MDQNFESMSVNGMPQTNGVTGAGVPQTDSAPGNGMPEANSVPRNPDAWHGRSASSSASGGYREDAAPRQAEESTEQREKAPSGRPAMDDHAIAADLLISAKNGVKTYAEAITEAATPSVKTLLKRQLDEAIAFQDQVGAYMTKKGWYNAYNVNQQILIDLNQTQDTMNRLGG